jgi:hypothetical protein
MPRRPPSKWMKDCVRGVKRKSRRSRKSRKRVTNPQAVCGALWYHKMDDAGRKAALKRHEKTRRTSGGVHDLEPGYWAMNAEGKPLAGPFPTREPADRFAKTLGGYVQYEPIRRTRSVSRKSSGRSHPSGKT